jgi:glucose-6-phosphate 1-dehydrogenase
MPAGMPASSRDRVTRFARHTPIDEQAWARFGSALHYQSGQFDDPASCAELARRLAELDREHGTQRSRFFYLATPPERFPTIICQLGEAELNHPPNTLQNDAHPFVRIVVEKPFGTDLASARRLNRDVQQVFDESQVYRIDHYLGKETVQNILAFRLANGIFEPIWNRNYIDHMQITVAESDGVGRRRGYYDQVGAFRDMVVDHMLQLLTIVAMEPPVVFEAEPMRDEKLKVLKALRRIAPHQVGERTLRLQPMAFICVAQRRERAMLERAMELHVGDIVIVKDTGRRALITAELPESHYQVEYLPEPADDPIDRDSSVSADEGGVYLIDDLQPVT